MGVVTLTLTKVNNEINNMHLENRVNFHLMQTYNSPKMKIPSSFIVTLTSVQRTRLKNRCLENKPDMSYLICELQWRHYQ